MSAQTTYRHLMVKTLVVFLALLAVLGVMPAKAWAAQNPFSDVTVGGSKPTSHANDIIWLAETGISTGWDTPKGKEFRPNSNVKRGDMAAFLFRLGKRWGLVKESFTPKAQTEAMFIDVNSRTSHRKEILWLAETGISTGWDTPAGKEFRPNDPVKRGQMAAFMQRMAVNVAKRTGKTTVDKTRFTDVNSKTAFCNQIWWLASNEITTGWSITVEIEDDDDDSDTRTPEIPFSDALAEIEDTTGFNASATETTWEYRPNNDVKRGDMAAFLHRLDNLK